MKKRLRKKLHKGEFAQLVLPIVVHFKEYDATNVSTDPVWKEDGLLMQFCDLCDAAGYEQGFAWGAGFAGAFYVHYRPDQACPSMLADFWKAQDIVENVKIHDSFDAWYGPFTKMVLP